MQAESAHSDPEAPLGPLASEWIKSLCLWYERLQRHFGFDPNDLASNVRNSLPRWKKRLQYLRRDHEETYNLVIDAIANGHKIPFQKEPQKFFRSRNSPLLANDKIRAWAAIKADISHGAITPVDIAKEGIPHCVCPVRTADKSNGKARFIHNSRKVNSCISEEHTKCTLESLLKTRNMFIPGGLLIGSDFASGYHCIFMHRDSQKYVAFALHMDDLTDDAKCWLGRHHKHAYYHKKRCYIFKYRVLPFGLSTSCAVFDTVISSLMGAWRRYSIAGENTRVSSYIDDISAVMKKFDTAMKMSIRKHHSMHATCRPSNNTSQTCSPLIRRHGIRVC